MSAMNSEVHMRTDANNLVTVLSTIRFPEQKVTVHLISSLCHECVSGAVDDLAHCVSVDCLADPLP